MAIITALITYRYWGGLIYAATRNWKVLAFVVIGGLIGTVIVFKQQELKYQLAYYYMTGGKDSDTLEARYAVRQCKEFVEAKLNSAPTEDVRMIKAGFINIGSVSNWDYCARTFGLNYWKTDISINGQDGGRLLCQAYARDTYRSEKVQTWCDTVFAPTPPQKAAPGVGI
ncbi:MAG: hypothetical protein GC204_09415 [Chloroflexi bacterium]|nr:hypothetical protein [Chloroflexota bacterium]